jgi:hypothetical protein
MTMTWFDGLRFAHALLSPAFFVLKLFSRVHLALFDFDDPTNFGLFNSFP